MAESSGICAEIVRSARHYSPADFRGQTFELLQSLCPFDAAVSGLATFGSDGHTAYDCTQLHKLTPDMLTAYAAVAGNDSVGIEVARRAALDVSCFNVRDHSPGSRFGDFLRYSGHYGLSNLLYGLTRHRPATPTEQRNYIALWRGSAADCYEMADIRHVKEALLCAVEVGVLNHELAVKRLATLCRPGNLQAIADANGLIQSADPGFVELISQQWPDWSRPFLPRELLSALGENSKARVYGRRVFISILRLPQTFLATARAETMLSAISNRELEVIQLMAKGYSIKRAAAALGIGGATIQAHLTKIYAALNIKEGKKTSLTRLLLENCG